MNTLRPVARRKTLDEQSIKLLNCISTVDIFAVDALKESENWGIHTFIASSQLHMKYKLQMDEDEVLKRSIAGALGQLRVECRSAQGLEPSLAQSPRGLKNLSVWFGQQAPRVALAQPQPQAAAAKQL